MANAVRPTVCEVCGRPLPVQQGRGRRRRYCTATCRDAARRLRRRSSSGDDVKENLTQLDRSGYLDERAMSSEDPVLGGVSRAVSHLLDESSGEGSPLGLVARTQELSAAAESALQLAVDRARAAGHSWREVGDVLGTSRQAAFQRFGHPVDPWTGEPLSREVLVGAEARAVGIFRWHQEGAWEKIIAELDDAMRARLHAAEMARGWTEMASMFGRLERVGTPFARRLSDDTVVEVPLHFEAGDARGLVRFSTDGRVTSLAIRPARPGGG
jgi:hypothetical protein